MFPTTGDLHIAPFFDDALYMEHFSKANFWLVNAYSFTKNSVSGAWLFIYKGLFKISNYIVKNVRRSAEMF